MAFYLDASVIVPLFVDDAHTQTIAHWLRGNESSFILSDFAAAEYASTISRLYRMRTLDDRSAASALDDFDHWRISSTTRRLTSPADIAAAERLVRRFELKLQAPDALHIAIALADGATLVTFDERQAQAMATLGACVVPD